MRSAVSDELVARLVSATCIRDCVKTHWIPPGFSRVEVQLEPKLVMNFFWDTNGFSRVEFQFWPISLERETWRAEFETPCG